MEFCDECGSLMFPAVVDGKKVFKCGCGAFKPFSEEKSEAYKLTTKIEHSVRDEVSNTSEMMKWKEENFESATKNFKCRKCGYERAQLETRQTRSADEGMTHFLICLRCGIMKKIGS